MQKTNENKLIVCDIAISISHKDNFGSKISTIDVFKLIYEFILSKPDVEIAVRTVKIVCGWSIYLLIERDGFDTIKDKMDKTYNYLIR